MKLIKKCVPMYIYTCENRKNGNNFKKTSSMKDIFFSYSFCLIFNT